MPRTTADYDALRKSCNDLIDWVINTPNVTNHEASLMLSTLNDLESKLWEEFIYSPVPEMDPDFKPALVPPYSGV